MSDMDLYVSSDEYFNHPDKYQGMKDMGLDVTPIDLNGGFVPTDKNDMQGNIEKSQETIRKRFGHGC